MLTSRAGHAAVTGNDGKIYAMGGYAMGGSVQDPTSESIASVEAFDPLTNTWAFVASMPTPRSSLAAVTAPDGRIWAVGGEDFKSGFNPYPLSEVEIFDPAWGVKGKWTPGKQLMSPLSNLAAAIGPDGKIYVMGGLDFDDQEKMSFFSIDPTDPNAEWKPEDPMATARSDFGAATGPDGLIYAIGGWSDGPTPAVEAFRVILPVGPPSRW
jgi:N-acetylneuraminic acid mutarotase